MSLRIALAVGFPLCLAATYFSPLLVRLLFGREFAESAGPLSILLWNALPFGICALLNAVITSLGRQRALIITHAVSLAVNLIVGPPLILRFGAVGASLALLSSVLCLLLMNHRLLAALVGGMPLLHSVWRPLGALLPPLGVLLLAGGGPPRVAPAVVAGAVYLLMAVLLKVVRPAEIRLLMTRPSPKQAAESPVAAT
jgi:O-antigen/teichoic acid export membrane protein